jgi:hypothetical protein
MCPPLVEVVATARSGHQQTTYIVCPVNFIIKIESPFIPFVSFGDLDNNTFKGLTSLLSVE